MSTQLTKLEIGEVSLVDRGAIGEVFSVIKCEDENSINQELIDQVDENGVKVVKSPKQSDVTNMTNTNIICDSLANMNDKDFVDIMDTMSSRYHEINKGGNKMNEEQVKEIIKSVVEEALTTVNKNFVSVNKSIDEIQKAVALTAKEKAKAKADAEDKIDGGSDEDTEDENGKKIKQVKKSVDSVIESMEDITKALNVVAEIKKSVDSIVELKLGETVSDLSKRLDKIENEESASNKLKDDVKKSEGAAKVPFWKSVLGVEVEETK